MYSDDDPTTRKDLKDKVPGVPRATPGRMTPLKKPTPPRTSPINVRPVKRPTPVLRSTPSKRGGFENPMIKDPGPAGNKPQAPVASTRKPDDWAKSVSERRKGGFKFDLPNKAKDVTDERKQAILRRLKKRRANNGNQDS